MEYELIGYTIRGPIEGSALARAKEIIAEITQPAGREQIALALTKLAAVTASRKQDLDLEAFMEVAIEDLSTFPSDVVEEACRRARRRERFLPTVSELLDDCYWLSRRRRAMQNLKVDGQQGGG